MTLTEINIEEFLKKDVSIVIFETTWFKPLKMMNPMIDKVSKELNLTLGRIDIEKFPEITVRYQIKTVPTFAILKKEELISTIEGVISEEELTNFLSTNI